LPYTLRTQSLTFIRPFLHEQHLHVLRLHLCIFEANFFNQSGLPLLHLPTLTRQATKQHSIRVYIQIQMWNDHKILPSTEIYCSCKKGSGNIRGCRSLGLIHKYFCGIFLGRIISYSSSCSLFISILCSNACTSSCRGHACLSYSHYIIYFNMV